MNRNEKSSRIGPFTTGSWYAYKLIDYDPPGSLTCGKIHKNMRVFNDKFKVEVNVYPASQLIFWELNLEEKTKEMKKRRSGGVPPKQNKNLPKVIKYKFAVSEEERLLFCHKVIPAKIKNELYEALYCDDFQPLDLCNGDPMNLLMFYKQSTIRAPGHLRLQIEDKLASTADEVPQGAPLRGEDVRMNTTGSLIHQKLGCNHEQIPHIKKVTTNMSNVPLKSKVAELKHFQVSKVEVEAYAPSVFHMYKELGDLGIINDIPPWLEKMRKSGKVYCKAKYIL